MKKLITLIALRWSVSIHHKQLAIIKEMHLLPKECTEYQIYKVQYEWYEFVHSVLETFIFTKY